MTDYAIGQRWLSETETELGLGIIEAIDHRLLQLDAFQLYDFGLRTLFLKLVELDFATDEDKDNEIGRLIVLKLNRKALLLNYSFHTLTALGHQLVHFKVASFSL